MNVSLPAISTIILALALSALCCAMRDQSGGMENGTSIYEHTHTLTHQFCVSWMHH